METRNCEVFTPDWNKHQARARLVVDSWIRSSRVPHAILLCGPKGIGKRRFAFQLASILLCKKSTDSPCGQCLSCGMMKNLSHPDLQFILPSSTSSSGPSSGNEDIIVKTKEYLYNDLMDEKANILIAQVRQLQRDMVYTATEKGRKLAVIFEADRMNPAASNSLLKILEEPLRERILILVSHFPDRLLPTIISRCQRLALHPMNRNSLRDSLQNESGESNSLELAVRMANGNLETGVRVLNGDFGEMRSSVELFIKAGLERNDEVYWDSVERIGNDRTEQMDFLRICVQYIRDLFLIRNGQEDMIVMVDRKGYLQSLIPYWDNHRIERVAIELDSVVEGLDRNSSFQLLLSEVWRLLRRCASVI